MGTEPDRLNAKWSLLIAGLRSIPRRPPMKFVTIGRSSITTSGYNAQMFGMGRPTTVQVRPRTCWFAFLLIVCFVAGMPLWAQEQLSGAAQLDSDPIGDLPIISRRAAIVPVIAHPPPQPAEHPFWDRENRLLFAGIGFFRALDYASTRNMQARGREEVLLPDEVVNNSAGFASLEAAGTAASVGLSYWMHRSGHHRIERWISVVHIGVTAFGAARNYSLKSKHPVLPAIR
jgi:hypothetical protein